MTDSILSNHEKSTMKTAPQMYRQGDVGIVRIDQLPDGATDVTPKDRIVLAYGEVTGHAHAIAPCQAREYSMAQAGAAVRRFLTVIEGGLATVRHEEHAPIPLPSGVYEILQQREYTPEAIRNVAD
jgi:hypothetical protein